MAETTKLHAFCSLLMAFLFAYSASVQLNDPDWYFWLPLYACACIVNLLNWVFSSSSVKLVSEVTLWLGIFLFIKVVVEDYADGVAGFFSLDLGERVVREKTGSGLVFISMILQLISNSDRNNLKLQRFVGYGTAFLVGFSYGLPFIFFGVQKGVMKF